MCLGVSNVCVCLQVHLCEAEGLVEFLEEDAPPLSDGENSVLVAVKQLRADATTNARSVAHSQVSFVFLTHCLCFDS